MSCSTLACCGAGLRVEKALAVPACPCAQRKTARTVDGAMDGDQAEDVAVGSLVAGEEMKTSQSGRAGATGRYLITLPITLHSGWKSNFRRNPDQPRHRERPLHASSAARWQRSSSMGNVWTLQWQPEAQTTLTHRPWGRKDDQVKPPDRATATQRLFFNSPTSSSLLLPCRSGILLSWQAQCRLGH